MYSYKCLNSQKFELGDYSLQTIQQKWIEDIRVWRNNQMLVLRQSKIISVQDQEKYFEEIIWPSMDMKEPKQILFGFLKNNYLIGYGGLVHISWIDKRTEISFLLDDKKVNDEEFYVSAFSNFLSLIKKVSFDVLNFNRIWTETYDVRENHIKVLEQCGFLLEGRMRQHIKMDNKFIDSLIHGCLK